MRYLMNVEPARVIAVVVAVIALATSLGLSVSDETGAAVVALVSAVLALVQGEMTRSQVSPANDGTNNTDSP